MFTFNPYQGAKSIAVLIDPDKDLLDKSLAIKIGQSQIDFVFIGGSQGFPFQKLDYTFSLIKENSKLPIIIFPGSKDQIHPQADALLALSLWQAKENKFVLSPLIDIINNSELKSMSILYTPYILLNTLGKTSVEKAINHQFQKIDNLDLFIQYLKTMKLLNCTQIYLEAGSGNDHSISKEWIVKARNILPSTYIIVGGGIQSTQQIKDAWNAGADCVVIGTQIEKDPSFIQEILSLKNS